MQRNAGPKIRSSFKIERIFVYLSVFSRSDLASVSMSDCPCLRITYAHIEKKLSTQAIAMTERGRMHRRSRIRTNTLSWSDCMDFFSRTRTSYRSDQPHYPSLSLSCFSFSPLQCNPFKFPRNVKVLILNYRRKV